MKHWIWGFIALFLAFVGTQAGEEIVESNRQCPAYAVNDGQGPDAALIICKGDDVTNQVIPIQVTDTALQPLPAGWIQVRRNLEGKLEARLNSKEPWVVLE